MSGPVVASNGFVVWAPTLAADPTRPDCPRHAFGDPDDSCTCPEATEVDRADCIERGQHDTANADGYCKSCGAA